MVRWWRRSFDGDICWKGFAKEDGGSLGLGGRACLFVFVYMVSIFCSFDRCKFEYMYAHSTARVLRAYTCALV